MHFHLLHEFKYRSTLIKYGHDFVTLAYGVIFLLFMILIFLLNFLPGMYHVLNYSYASTQSAVAQW